MNDHFDELAQERFASDSKVGLLVTTDEDGFPHAMLIKTLQTFGERQLTWGQFIQGMGKKLIVRHREVAFLVLNKQMELWRGKALYSHSEKSGEVFDAYSNKPLFRYNSYFGVGSVHSMDLKCVTEMQKLRTSEIALGAIKSRAVAKAAASPDEQPAMSSTTMELFGEMDGLKFLCYTDTDGYPWIVPAIQMMPAGRDRLVFSFSPFGEELHKVPAGAKVAVFFANLQLQTVMIKGEYLGPHKYSLGSAGVIDVKKVYNPMPPQSGYIYPKPAIEKVTEF